MLQLSSKPQTQTWQLPTGKPSSFCKHTPLLTSPLAVTGLVVAWSVVERLESPSQRYPGLVLEETPGAQSGAGAGTQPPNSDLLQFPVKTLRSQ